MPAPSNNKKSNKSKKAKPQPTSTTIDSHSATADPSISCSSTTTPIFHSSLQAPAETTFDFAFFIENANGHDIQNFLQAALSSSEGCNLELLFMRAFREGKKRGYQEGEKSGFDEGKSAGYDIGYNDGYAAAGEGLLPPPPCSLSHVNSSTQTESEPPVSVITCNANIQACTSFADASAQISTPVDYDAPMDPISIDNLCSHAAASTSFNTPLGTVWKCAFKAGQDDGSQKVDGIQVSDMLKIGFEKGQVHGIIEERTQWEMAGHSQTCFVTTNSSTVAVDTGTQVDTTAISLPRLDASIQATTPPLSPSQPQKTSTSHLNWAEEMESLPITPPLPSSPPRQPHDLSVLCSSSHSPFSSLQHCSKRSTRCSHQSRRRHRHLYSDFPNPQPHCSPIYIPPPRRRGCQQCSSPKSTFSSQDPAQLNWDSDPRLLNLSHALKALGWIFPS